MKSETVLALVRDELLNAQRGFPPFHSAHEGHSVIKEEFDELWEEIKKHHSERDPEKLRKEAIQVAAMAVRFCVDLL